jgi:DNA-binding GntR family transcriptional regulator
MEKIKQSSLHGEAAQRIRTMITNGRLEAGGRIPEKKLCEQFGISRTPLREALKVLATEGFVELLPNRGARVVELTHHMFRNTLEVMSALEGLSGELACQHITAEEITTLRHLQKLMTEHYEAGNLNAYFEVNRQIHEKLVSTAANQVLMDMYKNLNERVRWFRFSTKMDPKRWKQALDEHEQMIEALEAQDGARLGHILRNHISFKVDEFAEN